MPGGKVLAHRQACGDFHFLVQFIVICVTLMRTGRFQYSEIQGCACCEWVLSTEAAWKRIIAL